MFRPAVQEHSKAPTQTDSQVLGSQRLLSPVIPCWVWVLWRPLCVAQGALGPTALREVAGVCCAQPVGTVRLSESRGPSPGSRGDAREAEVRADLQTQGMAVHPQPQGYRDAVSLSLQGQPAGAHRWFPEMYFLHAKCFVLRNCRSFPVSVGTFMHSHLAHRNPTLHTLLTPGLAAH